VTIPSELSNLALWLQADAIGGLNDGDPVATWTDSSGGGHDATQATSGLRPTYRANVLNGRAAVRFDATDDRLDGTVAGGTATVGTLFYVISLAAPRVNAIRGVFVLTEWSSSAYAQSASVTNWGMYQGTATQTAPANLNFPYGPTQITNRFNGDATSAIRENGVTILTSSGGASAMGGTAYNVGNHATVAWPSNSDRFELVLFDRALTDSEVVSIELYLRDKWMPVVFTPHRMPIA
jgi:hypothetical protein